MSIDMGPVAVFRATQTATRMLLDRLLRLLVGC